MAVNAIVKFLNAARSLVNQGMSKEAVMNFAKNEFGEINELFKKQIDNLFKPKQGIENIKLKDEVFDDTVVKMQFDDSGVPFNPKDPLKTKSLTYEEAIAREKAKAAADEDYIIKVFDPEDFAKGGRAGLYTGGMVDVEPNLSDIGHGSDSLMARTRLISPNNQATTSTGLNYLLAEDNDNIRVPFSAGGGGRRAFLKMLGLTGAGIAGAKTGILGLGGGTGKKAVTEAVKQSAGSGQPPPYFFKLVEKIKTMGDDIGATQDRTIAKSMKSKDGKSEYILEEDVSTGSTIIKKINKESDDMVTDVEIMQHSKGQADELTKGKKPADSYEEVTEYQSRIYKDEFNEPDYVDGIKVDEIIEEVGETVTKKADGGRIGFSGGNLAKFLAGKKITGSSRTFLEKVFGKESFENMIRNDPEMHRGLLEVVEMFRKRDKEGLKMYMQKFLPHMDDATVEDFIIGSGGTEGIEGQLIRLGSGRDYAGKIEMMKRLERNKALRDLDVTDEMIRKPNAKGGLQTMLGE